MLRLAAANGVPEKVLSLRGIRAKRGVAGRSPEAQKMACAALAPAL